MTRACTELGDLESAAMELDAAEKLFHGLGAEPDLARIRTLRANSQPSGSDILTAREREVLALMAAGDSNRTIAGELGLSPKTVNRHVENIFGKLSVSSRAAVCDAGRSVGLDRRQRGASRVVGWPMVDRARHRRVELARRHRLLPPSDKIREGQYELTFPPLTSATASAPSDKAGQQAYFSA